MVVIKVASDLYAAYISIDMDSKSKKLTHEEIYEELNAKNVVHGIDNALIDKIVSDNKAVYEAIIAKGTAHKNGADGKIELVAKVKDDNKHFEGDGFKVNFKERNFAVSIHKGDLIARITKPTQGEPGMSVTGKTIVPKPGKEIRAKAGKNVVLSDDGTELYSTTFGTLKMENGFFSVIESLTINGDVGIKTGNIKFVGKVIVTGNVQSGYVIESDEDVEISGGVEDAMIRCNNLTIWQGVQGSDNTKLDVKGNLKVKFMSNCTAVVGGNIESGSLLNCRVRCYGGIDVQGKIPIIVGGEIEAYNNITAGSIGSETGANTVVRVGNTSEISKKIDQLTDIMNVDRENDKKFKQIMTLLKDQVESDRADKDLIQKYEKVLESHRELSIKIKRNAERMNMFNKKIEELQSSQIVARTLYVGTKVKLGNSVYIPKENFKDVIVSKEGGNVIVKPM